MIMFSDQALSWLERTLASRFGHSFVLKYRVDSLALELVESEGRICFDNLQTIFHQSRSDFSCYQWIASNEGYVGPVRDCMPAPSEHELSFPLIEIYGSNATIHYDILGLTYWMLSRLEEVGRKDLDYLERFPATSSHAYKHDYLERPIIDEWLDILGQVMRQVWPEIQLKTKTFSMQVSHDVDSPSLYAFKSWEMIARMMASNLVKKRDLRAFFLAPLIKLISKKSLHHTDPYNTFDWIMDVSDEHDIKSAFYFICGRTNKAYDAEYNPDHPAIRNLMRRIHSRGHEIGLHPSFNTFKTPKLIEKEAGQLKRICTEESIVQPSWGGRMHYLRWEQATTLRAWADANMSYDTTLGYADRPGFRCGTCYEYSAFDPVTQDELKLSIRPLIVMESSIIGSTYMALGVTKEAEEKMKLLKTRCRVVGGNFSFLWHNSSFTNECMKNLYRKILDY